MPGKSKFEIPTVIVIARAAFFQTQGSKIGHHFSVTFMKICRKFGHLICFNERFVIFYRLWKFFADLLLAQGEERWFTMWLAGLSMNIGAQSTRGGFASSFWGGDETEKGWQGSCADEVDWLIEIEIIRLYIFFFLSPKMHWDSY